MKDYWKNVWRKLYTDLKQYSILFLALVIYILLSYLIKFTICPLRAILGIPCPGCGITRAIVSILMLDFKSAWQLHPFAYLVILSAILWFVGKYFTNWKMKWFEYYATAIGIGMLLFYLYRMLLFFPSTEPMVYNASSLLGLLLKFVSTTL